MAEEDMYICATCGKTCRHRRSLRLHEKEHAGTLTFVCCVKRFASDRDLERHMSWHNVFVLTSCYLMSLLYNGLAYSFGTIFTDIMSTFGSSRAETSVIHTALVSVFMLSGGITGMLIKKFGFVGIGVFGSLLFSFSLMTCFFASSLTFVIICVGVFTGIGLSCIEICTADVIGQQFSSKKKQVLYMTMCSVSCGIGGTVYPYVLRYLSDLYTWRVALLLIGAISLNAVPGCLLWKLPSNEKRDPYREHNSTLITTFQTRMQVKIDVNGERVTIQKTDQTDTQFSNINFVEKFPVLKGETSTKCLTVTEAGHKQKSATCNFASNIVMHIKSVLCNKCFMLVVFGTIFAIPSVMIILMFVGDIYADNELTNDDVAFGLLLVNIFSLIGRLLLGFAMHTKFISTLLLPLLCSLVSAVIFLLFPFVKARGLILTLTGIFGVPIGMFTSMYTVLTLKLIDTNLLPVAIGIFYTLNGIVNLAYGPLNGFIRDVTGSYITCFYIGTVVQIAAAFVYFLGYITRKKQRKNDTQLKHSAIFDITSF